MTKLTLSVDLEIIKKAKDYANQQHTSLSRLVENFFKQLNKPTSEKYKNTKITNELIGIASVDKIKDSKDPKLSAILEKYVHD
jgi:hypothetical protein